jgi:hypothetical protein
MLATSLTERSQQNAVNAYPSEAEAVDFRVYD